MTFTEIAIIIAALISVGGAIFSWWNFRQIEKDINKHL